MKRNNIYSFLLLLFMAMSFCSCATLFSKKQTVIVNSDIEGALVYKGKKYVGMTPLKFKTKAAKSTFTIYKAGYPTQKIYANVGVRWNTLWNYFNGFFLWPIDLMTGASQKYKTLSYDISLKNPEKNKVYDKYNRELIAQQYMQQYQQQRQNNQGNGEEIAMAIFGGVLEGIAQSKQIEAERKLQEAERQAQFRAAQQARVAQNKQKYADFQVMTNNKTYSSNYQSNSSYYRTQGSYNDMLTSDPNRNVAVQQSVQQYGASATRNAVNQTNAYNVQPRSTGGYGGQIITAVTSNRRAIKIQVRDRKIGGRIVAYSLGGNVTGQQQWRPTDGIISRCTSNMEYQYTAYLQGVGNIYFDM